jgi:hypothetical protein
MQIPSLSKYRRFRLSHFLLTCAALGAASGIYGSAYLNTPTYRKLERSCDGYLAESMWKKKPFDDERLVYLVAYAKGPVGFGCCSAYDGDRPVAWGVSRIASGLYYGSAKVSSVDRKGWVYSAYEGRWGKLQPISAKALDDLTPADFERLERLDIWKSRYRPLLDKESATFAKMHKEAPDPRKFWYRVFRQ